MLQCIVTDLIIPQGLKAWVYRNYIIRPSISKKKGTPIILRLRKCVFVVMDVPSRMECAHGILFGLKTHKYTIMFKCDHTSDVTNGEDDIPFGFAG
jgi:hypothetical protein